MPRGCIGASMVTAGRRIEKKIPQVTAYEYKCAKGHAVVYEKN